MEIAYRQIAVNKRYPLTISRGTITGTVSLFVTVTRNGVSGLGEMCPGALTGAATAEAGEAELRRLQATGLDGLEVEAIWQRGFEMHIAPCALAALDMALWDLRAKAAGLPLYRCLGLALPAVPTSVTVGLNPPDVVRERVPELLARTGAKYLKVKLGSPLGIGMDREVYLAAKEGAARFNVGLRVDANGGWTVDRAREMLRWLAEQGADYVEQPLAAGLEADLAYLARRPLPCFVDESCVTSADLPKWAQWVDGCNLKLMKCGGITEARRIVAAARNHGLQTMIGCNGETSVAIAAGAALGALFDHIDLDSHLNLAPDPADGAPIVDGVVTPTERPGHGGRLLA